LVASLALAGRAMGSGMVSLPSFWKLNIEGEVVRTVHLSELPRV
jgi:hypothetical protein